MAQDGTGLMVCGFSEQGTFIFAGSNDCCVYVWHWDLDLEQWGKSGSEAPAPSYEDNDPIGDLSLSAEEKDMTRYTNFSHVMPASCDDRGCMRPIRLTRRSSLPTSSQEWQSLNVLLGKRAFRSCRSWPPLPLSWS